MIDAIVDLSHKVGLQSKYQVRLEETGKVECEGIPFSRAYPPGFVFSSIGGKYAEAPSLFSYYQRGTGVDALRTPAVPVPEPVHVPVPFRFRFRYRILCTHDRYPYVYPYPYPYPYLYPYPYPYPCPCPCPCPCS